MDHTEKIISFCTGYGGIELGLHRVIENLRTICYVEVETFAIANLVAKIEQDKLDAAPIWSDIKTFPAQIFRDKVHGIVGGYPCQPFSHAGKRLGRRDPRHLWPDIKKHIRTIRPVWCFFENVSGHLSKGFKEVVFSLQYMGYKVEAGLFTAAEVGASHKRERLFILANSTDDIRGRYTSGRINHTEIGPAGEVLADHNNGRCKAIPNLQTGQSATALSCRKLADTKCAEQGIGIESIKGETTEHRGNRSPNNRWPARPDQPQHEWEEPRTVKPGMGRTVDGLRSRVDELRLLGNGVVPAQAELAFRTLIEKAAN